MDTASSKYVLLIILCLTKGKRLKAKIHLKYFPVPLKIALHILAGAITIKATGISRGNRSVTRKIFSRIMPKKIVGSGFATWSRLGKKRMED